MIFNFRKHERKIDEKEKVIVEQKRRQTRKMDSDINKLKAINKILDNGITLEIRKGMGNHHV